MLTPFFVNRYNKSKHTGRILIVHLILKTRDSEDSASMLRFVVSIHIKKGCNFKKITEKFGRIMLIWQLKPLCLCGPKV